jgi:hypothetical protein
MSPFSSTDPHHRLEPKESVMMKRGAPFLFWACGGGWVTVSVLRGVAASRTIFL